MSYTLVLEWMPGDLYMSAVTARCTAPTSSYSVVWLPPNKVYQITLYCGSTSLVSFLVGAFRGKAWSYMSEMTAKATLPACPVETTLTLIGDKWKVLILRDLMPGTKRFGELKKSVGNVSQKVLTAQLRAMEENGLVHREVYAEVPPRVEYSLTELGKSLKPILDSMQAWGEAYKAKQ